MSASPATATPVGPPTDHATLIAALRHRVDGDVYTPGDPGRDDAGRPWNLAMEHSPAVTVVAENVGDVVATVTFAAELGRGLGVQATGHGASCPVDGVLLVTDRLREVVVDPEERTAWVGAGCTAAEVLTAAQTHGLAPLVGSASVVGMVGYTLGGGLGWLARKYGPACDAVRSFEVVTPDGELVRACRNENAELFRALRGGGGCAGVVTDMEIELFPVTDVYAGNLYYPVDAAPDIVARYAAWAAGTPDDLTSAVAMVNVPPLPGLPEELRGRSFTVVRGCWSGALDEGRALLDGWRAMAPPMIDAWSEMPFSDVATISKDPVDPLPVVATGGWLADVDAEVGAVLAAGTFPVDGPPPLMFSQIRHLGGAVASGDREHSSMGNRDGQFLLQLVAVPGPAGGPAAAEAHQRDLKARLGAHLSDRTFVNVLDGAERRRCAPTAFDEADRAVIATACRRFDPAGVLRFGIDHDA